MRRRPARDRRRGRRRDYTEQKPVEEVAAGDHARSRPEDNADGQLGFHPVTETYTNTTDEVIELWVVNYASGEHDHITTTPFPRETVLLSGTFASRTTRSGRRQAAPPRPEALAKAPGRSRPS